MLYIRHVVFINVNLALIFVPVNAIVPAIVHATTISAAAASWVVIEGLVRRGGFVLCGSEGKLML